MSVMFFTKYYKDFRVEIALVVCSLKKSNYLKRFDRRPAISYQH